VILQRGTVPQSLLSRRISPDLCFMVPRRAIDEIDRLHTRGGTRPKPSKAIAPHRRGCDDLAVAQSRSG
jgi:hypothetical protein